MHPDAQSELAAYREAWDARKRTGRTDAALLHDALARHGRLDELSDGYLETLTHRWESGVPPRRLRLSLLRETPALMFRATIKPAIAVVRALRGRT